MLEQYGVAAVFINDLNDAFEGAPNGKASSIHYDTCLLLFASLFPEKEKDMPYKPVNPQSIQLFQSIFQSLFEAYWEEGYTLLFDRYMEAILPSLFHQNRTAGYP